MPPSSVIAASGGPTLEVGIGEDCANGIHQDDVGEITTAPGIGALAPMPA
ncbi:MULTISPECIES: hypothetical protein [Pseudomonas]|nr:MULTISPECIES: hypothetical protein [Pseudomonas]AZC19248.1 hypothetical protein C4K40_3863 [Pseudomonas sp. CMR5c]ERO65428.1 hypothetical protein P308_19165 [Pseudomonas piscis]